MHKYEIIASFKAQLKIIDGRHPFRLLGNTVVKIGKGTPANKLLEDE